MLKYLMIPCCTYILTWPCLALQQFIWLTDSSAHQQPQQYRQALDVNALTLDFLMKDSPNFQAVPLQTTTERAIAIGGGRSYGEQLDSLLQQPHWQHKFWQRRSVEISAGLIDMLLQDRVDLLIEYPNVMQHYLEHYNNSGGLTSFNIKEAEPYMLGYILCAKTPQGKRLTEFFQHRLQQVSQDKHYLA